ncbi:hypothetical protein ACFFRR_007390 [Megaselia abdita]
MDVVISITVLSVILIPSVYSVITCPVGCFCKWELDSLSADCSGGKFKQIPEEILDLPIEILDLSRNEFEEFPMDLRRMTSLQHLKLSQNKLKALANDTLRILPRLISIDLSYNGFQNLKDIHPDTLLLGADSLTNLSLAGNAMEIFTDLDETHILRSESLLNLDMSYCKISKAIGSYVLSGLPSLETLILSGNDFGSLVSFPATNIHNLVLSNCSLSKLGSHFFDNIKNLENLDLSHNPGITFGTKAEDILDSNQLKILDISYCNLFEFDTRGFPNLIALMLQGNMLKKITAEHLAQNSALKKVNLSNNGVRVIDIRAFEELVVLEDLDLSYNNLQTLEDNLFQDNPALTKLNLERNFFKSIGSLRSESLEILNFRWCEIESVTADSLQSLPKLKTLLLSYNLISNLPRTWGSPSVKTLNLARNRLVTVLDYTLRNFPSIVALDLSGNRLTNTFTIKSFERNTRLDQIWLGDNAWRCECSNENFRSFYDFIGPNDRNPKIQDPQNLKCQSPSNYAGRTWENACLMLWNPPPSRASNQHIMTGILCTIVIIAGLLFAASCVKKYIHNRRKRQNDDELRDNVREMRNIQRMNNEFLASQQNISQPIVIRESNPPPYEEALLMPKLERNFKSMDDIVSSRRAQKKLNHSPTTIEMEQNLANEQSPPMKSKNRFRSEQFLNRHLERTAAIDPYPRSGRAINNSGSRVFAYEDGHFASSQIKLGNLQCAEQGNDFKDYDYSPYTKRKNKDLGRQSSFQVAIQDRKSIEFLTDSECSSIQNSPFARRKPIGSTNSILSTHKKSTLSLRPIEDHFGISKNQSLSSNDFVKMSADPSESDLSMVGDVGEICAVVHQAPECTSKSTPPHKVLRTCSTDL